MGSAGRNRAFVLWLVLGAGVLAVVALGVAWAASLAGEVTSPNTTAGHHDFFAFYSAAELVGQRRPDALYDRDAVMAAQRAFFAAPVGWAGYMAYLNPPFAAVLQLPLAAFSEEVARLVWLAVSLLAATACAVLLTDGLPGRSRWLVGLVLMATFPVYQALVEGQWSFVLLLGCLTALAAARRGHPFVAGLCVGVLAIKPPLLLLVLVWLLLARRWRVLAGAIATPVALSVAALPLTGVAPYATYARYMLDVAVSHTNGAGQAGPAVWNGSIWNMEGLNGLAVALAGQENALATNVLTLAGAVLVLAVVLRTLPSVGGPVRAAGGPLSTAGAVVAVCAGLLLYPNLYGQDCVLALVLFPILAARLDEPWARLALALAIAVVLDLAVLDTAASQDALLAAPHIPTLAMLALVAVCALPQRWRARLAWRATPAETAA